MVTLAERIRTARESNGLTQQELAKKVGVDATSIRNYEHSRSTPRQRTLKALESVLGASLRGPVNAMTDFHAKLRPGEIGASEWAEELDAIFQALDEWASGFSDLIPKDVEQLASLARTTQLMKHGCLPRIEVTSIPMKSSREQTDLTGVSREVAPTQDAERGECPNR